MKEAVLPTVSISQGVKTQKDYIKAWKHLTRELTKKLARILVYWAGQKNLVKGCRETLDCYCVRCELLSASIADTLLFVNILVSGIFHGHFAQRLAVNKPCLQIVRRLLWKQTTTHSIRNNNAMFEQQPLSQFKGPSQYRGQKDIFWCHVVATKFALAILGINILMSNSRVKFRTILS